MQHYREARTAMDEHTNVQTDTEHLRRAMVHYRALFHALVDDGTEQHSDTENQTGENRVGRQ